MEYATRLERARVPPALVDEAYRLMIDGAYNKLNARDPRERSVEELITDIRAAWAFIHQVLTREGYRLGPVGVDVTHLT